MAERSPRRGSERTGVIHRLGQGVDKRVMADLDPRFTFDNFVVGPANRLASAAARRAADNPGTSYNPLFIYSASGLGKTHILGAIANHAAKNHPEKNVAYQTLEGFLAELTEALGGGNGVRARYDGVEILLMDDIQFLTGQAQAQEMLLRMLDTLTGARKQVVLASDRPPNEIDGLDSRLRSRFEGGLLVDIGSPEYETRIAILRRQAEARGQTLSAGVAEVIGRVPFKNVRELGGALNRILAIQELEGRAVSPDEATALLGDSSSMKGKGSDLGKFLNELTHSVAVQVELHEAPWRQRLREVAEEVEKEGFKGDRLRRLLEKESPPGGVDGIVEDFLRIVQRLKEVKTALDAVGNPWPEAAHGVLKDPERLDEAEALLASARERARPFPAIEDGPTLSDLPDALPQLVIRAAEQLINSDRPEYNPLFVWSPDGETARSLLSAAGRTFKKGHGEAKVALISVAEFAEEFIGALSGGVAGAWRERWWSAELLLIEDAQDLAKMERAQEEFFHLFEALQRRRARVMVAADRPPARIGSIDDRLRSRFEGGLVLEIEGRGRKEPATPAREEAKERFQAWDREPPRSAEVPVEKGREGKKDVSALDREWIMGFTAGDGVPSSAGAAEPRGGVGSRGASLEEGAIGEIWFPSPERVIWLWPRISERVVEDPD
jgi:chromosomal replication initiation ATPase DnaA